MQRRRSPGLFPRTLCPLGRLGETAVVKRTACVSSVGLAFSSFKSFRKACFAQHHPRGNQELESLAMSFCGLEAFFSQS